MYDSLIVKLINLNFARSSLEWISSYLDNRSQAKNLINGNTSLLTCAWLRGGVTGHSILHSPVCTYRTFLLPRLHDYQYNFYADDLMIYLRWNPHDTGNGMGEINSGTQGICKPGWGFIFRRIQFSQTYRALLSIGSVDFVEKIALPVSLLVGRNANDVFIDSRRKNNTAV